MGEEMDSPRGRIVLMKQALEGDLPLHEAQRYIDRCLGCLGCETACPSGVRYRELLVPFRAQLEEHARPLHERLYRAALLAVLESPARFRVAHRLGRIAQRIARVAMSHGQSEQHDSAITTMLSLLPSALPPAEKLSPHTPAVGTRRARVALLAGCVQQALRPSINTATVRVLAANGVEVFVPADQGCCGALALHTGLKARAHALEAQNVQAFPRGVDAIITNAAGCGSAMKEGAYPARVLDIAEFLDEIGLTTRHRFVEPTTVAYHDACHLGHAQSVRAAPRRLLKSIANIEVVDLHDSETCCGSAGLYNLEQPDAAARLGRLKARAVATTGAHIVATGNIGCITQIAAYAIVPVRHTIELLDSTYSSDGTGEIPCDSRRSRSQPL
jgi:glycolate oxidase iron-sulfur subunit